ncbi:Biotin carboxylase [Pseudomonas asturiensis]|uniref:Biotin carboxylase n=1 Tax=Pseudomonas asturiensis TaxID=1190415 RepID=A0A1M7J710_9PSED|nr:ATP-grasp domain-containing protein [Pseudomonas asturiensis]SHM48237.1 Biotin carboxylase [Pseudomonas asturiensis]
MTLSNRYALLIGADLPMRERAVLCTARALGMAVVVLAYPGEVLAQRRRPAASLADDYIVSPYLLDPVHALEAVKDYERKTGLTPAAVIPVNDFVLEAGAAIAKQYSIPFHSDAVILRCRDKLLMKAELEKAGLNVAPTLAVNEGTASYVFKDQEKAIFKPSVFGGSGGVRLVSNSQELQVAIDDAAKLLHKYKDILYIDPERIHLEAFLDSELEVSVEVYCRPDECKAAAVTHKQLSPRPYFAEMGHIVPYAGFDYDALCETAEKACRALGIERGVSHVEIKIVEGVPFIIEVGARPAGDRIIDLVYRSLGVDLYALHAKSYCDIWDDMPLIKRRGTAAVAFLKAAPGKITCINPVVLPEGVHELSLYKGVGDFSARDAQNFETREGHVEWFWPIEHQDTPDFMFQTARLSADLFEIERN